LETLIREALVSRFRESVPQKLFDEIVERVLDRNLSPWEAVKMLIGPYPERAPAERRGGLR